MKKIFFAAIIFAGIFSSCSDSKKFEKRITITKDTTVMVPGETKVLTSPRWNCSGQKLKQPKLVGTEKGPLVPTKVTMTKDTVVTFGNDDSVVVTGNSPTPDSDGGLGDILEMLAKLFGILILLILSAWIIWWLIRNWPKGQNHGETKIKNSGSTHAIQTSSINKDDYSGIAMVITELKKGTSGGRVQLGALVVSIPSSVPDITVNADRGANVDININIEGDDIVNADMIDVHEGDDHRSYNRQSGGPKDQKEEKKN